MSTEPQKLHPEPPTLDPSAIRWRVGQISKKDPHKGSLLGYIDARTCMEALDELDPNWSAVHGDPIVVGDELIGVPCALTVNGVTRSDVGMPSSQEPIKGAYSDALKRAAVHFGIGRELYELPRIYVKLDDYKKPVAIPTYRDGRWKLPSGAGSVFYDREPDEQPQGGRGAKASNPDGRPAASPHTRFWAKVLKTDGCWEWQGKRDADGYGRFKLSAARGAEVTIQAHRFAYQDQVGPLTDGLQIDHLCRNRACVNPDHLEEVTQQENIERGDSGRGKYSAAHCERGHEFTEQNTRWATRADGRRFRECRTCKAARPAASYQALRGQLLEAAATHGWDRDRLTALADEFGVVEKATEQQLRDMLARIEQPGSGVPSSPADTANQTDEEEVRSSSSTSTPDAGGHTPAPATAPGSDGEGSSPAHASESGPAPTDEELLAAAGPGAEIVPPKPGSPEYKALPNGSERAKAKAWWDAHKDEPQQETLAEALGSPVESGS